MTRVLLIPCTLTCRNMGDVALLQVTVARLRALLPDAMIQIPTTDAQRLIQFCPDVMPLDYHEWLDDHYLLGGLRQHLPHTLSQQMIAQQYQTMQRWPALVLRATRLKLRLRGQEVSAFDAFCDAATNADLVAVSGAGGMADRFGNFVSLALGSLQIAIRAGKPTVLFSQGMGPLDNPLLRKRAAAVLPSANLVAVRERRAAVALLAELGVDPNRTLVTGDDAIELAHTARVPNLGEGIGINVRVAPAAGVSDTFVEQLRPVLHAFARERNAPLVPLPIALQNQLDGRVIHNLLRGYNRVLGSTNVETPLDVIKQAGQCRIVVTGAYHAAVFALAQGIPTVCLAQSPYYINKLLGLADMFGEGCQVVILGNQQPFEQIRAAMERAWEQAETQREPLQAAATQQIAMSHNAYAVVPDLLYRKQSTSYVPTTHCAHS